MRTKNYNRYEIDLEEGRSLILSGCTEADVLRLESGLKALSENLRLRAALSGISSCCTCEACRNAALKALERT